MYKEIVDFVKALYPNEAFVPLHAPIFNGNEKKYVNDCIDSTFVSSVGEYVNKFEDSVCRFTGAKYAVATTNGTSALHLALVVMNVEKDTEVLTQALTFVATVNAISYVGAHPVFLDSNEKNLGMSAESLELFLNEYAEIRDNYSINKKTGRRISACVPMHVFGHPVEMDKIKALCVKYKISLIEDAAESLGSYYRDEHTGLNGDLGILSFNGNKIVTCGGGGMIITNNEILAKKAKHLSTTAKRSHKWEFFHEEVGYNYRLPNINAALGLAQMEMLPDFIKNKRETAEKYRAFFINKGIKFISDETHTKSNYWLNAIQLNSLKERDEFLDYSNSNGVMTRPIWNLMSDLPAFSGCLKMPLPVARHLFETIVNIPSSVRVEL